MSFILPKRSVERRKANNKNNKKWRRISIVLQSFLDNSNRNIGNVVKFNRIAMTNSIRWIIIFKLIDRY